MSSVDVRAKIKTFLTVNAPSEDVIDLTAVYSEIKELLEAEGITSDSPWLGLQFVGDDETPVTVPATNDQGKYREIGAVFFHVVDVAKLGVGDSLLTRGETLRNLMRGQRIDGIVIQSVSPMNFDSGATLQFEGGFMSGSFIVNYEYDFDL